MEHLVVSPETAKRLKAAGFDQRTLWGWREDSTATGGFRLETPQEGGGEADAERYAAPTAEEVAARLPDSGFALLRVPRTAAPRYRSNAYSWSHEADTMAESLAGLYLKQHEAMLGA